MLTHYYQFCIAENKQDWITMLENHKTRLDQRPDHYPCLFVNVANLSEYKLVEHESDIYNFIMEKEVSLKMQLNNCERMRRYLIESGIKYN